MPHLNKLQSEHRDKLVVIAPHSQNVDEATVVKFLRQSKVVYTVTSSGQIKGAPGDGKIPHVVLFDHKGEMVFDGRPSDGKFNKLVEESIKAAPDWFLGDHTYKKLKSQAAQIASRKNMGKVLAELRLMAAASDADKDTAEEAGWLMERLEPYGKGLLSQAAELVDKDPAKALVKYTEASTMYAGCDIGDEASAKLKELRADEGFKKELEAADMMSKVEAGAEKLQPCKNGQPLNLADCADCKKRNADKLGGLVGQLRAIAKKYEGTHAASEAATMLEAWGAK